MRTLTQEQVKTGVVGRKRRSWKELGRQGQAFSFTLPALVLLAIFLIYPICYVVFLSFQRWNLLGSPQYIGLQNYVTILFKDASFLQSLGVSVFFVVLAVPAQVGLGLYLAILLDSEFRGRTFFRALFFMPLVVSFVAAGVVFEWMFSTGAIRGTIPQLLSNIGIQVPDWQHNGFWGILMIVLMNTWKSAGFSMILYLAGLQSINPDYYEAAQIDGIRNAWQRFRFISWPLLVPTTTLLIITNTIGSFQAFVPFFVMTGGGPAGSTTSLVYYIYNNFTSRTGIASAAATLFLIGVLMITAVQLLVARRSEAY